MGNESPKKAPQQQPEVEPPRKESGEVILNTKDQLERVKEKKIFQLKLATIGASEAASEFVDIADEWLEGMAERKALPAAFVERLERSKQWSDTPWEDRQEYFVEFVELLTEAVAYVDKKDPEKMWKDPQASYEELVEGAMERVLEELKKTSYRDAAERVEKSFHRQGEYLRGLTETLNPTKVDKIENVKK